MRKRAMNRADPMADRVRRKVFIKMWNKGIPTREIEVFFGQKKDWASRTASRLRRDGYILEKRMVPGGVMAIQKPEVHTVVIVKENGGHTTVGGQDQARVEAFARDLARNIGGVVQ